MSSSDNQPGRWAKTFDAKYEISDFDETFVVGRFFVTAFTGMMCLLLKYWNVEHINQLVGGQKNDRMYVNGIKWEHWRCSVN